MTSKILLGQDALMAFNGDIDQAVAKVIPSASDAGKSLVWAVGDTYGQRGI